MCRRPQFFSKSRKAQSILSRAMKDFQLALGLREPSEIEQIWRIPFCGKHPRPLERGGICGKRLCGKHPRPLERGGICGKRRTWLLEETPWYAARKPNFT